MRRRRGQATHQPTQSKKRRSRKQTPGSKQRSSEQRRGNAPADPEQEGAEDDERRRVTAEVASGRAVGLEAAAAGAEEEGTNEAREAADEVDGAAAGKVDHADAEEGVGPRRREEA